MTKEAVLNKRHYDGRITFGMTRHDRNEIFERAKAERISIEPTSGPLAVIVVRCRLLTPKRTRAVGSSELISRMRATVIELILRFILGGLIVSLFAIIGDVLKPRTFAGLFAAAPSVALATLGLTIWIEGKLYAAAEARSMIVGAIALFVYAIVVIHLIMNHKLHAASATICAIPAWLICSVGTWFLVLR